MGERLSETKPQPTGNEATLRLSIEGMHCSSCVGHVEKALQSVDGVVDASVSLADSSARVSADGVSPDALVAAVVSEIQRRGLLSVAFVAGGSMPPSTSLRAHFRDCR